MSIKKIVINKKKVLCTLCAGFALASSLSGCASSLGVMLGEEIARKNEPARTFETGEHIIMTGLETKTGRIEGHPGYEVKGVASYYAHGERDYMVWGNTEPVYCPANTHDYNTFCTPVRLLEDETIELESGKTLQLTR